MSLILVARDEQAMQSLAATITQQHQVPVHDQAVLVAVELEYPECVAGPPIIFVAVENNGRVVRNPLGSAELRKSLFIDVVADNNIL